MKTITIWLTILAVFGFHGRLFADPIQVHELKPYVEFPAPNGYLILDGPSLQANRIPASEVSATVLAGAYYDGPDGRFYISDWSWERFQSKRIPPNWVYILPPNESRLEKPIPVLPSDYSETLDTPRLVFFPAGARFYDLPRGNLLHLTSESLVIEVLGWRDTQGQAKDQRWFQLHDCWAVPSNDYQGEGKIRRYPKVTEMSFPIGYAVRSGVGPLAPVVQVRDNSTLLDIVAEVTDDEGISHYITSWTAEQTGSGRLLTTVVPMADALASTRDRLGKRGPGTQTFNDLFAQAQRGEIILQQIAAAPTPNLMAGQEFPTPPVVLPSLTAPDPAKLLQRPTY